MPRNSDRFITSFNRIDKALDSELDSHKGIGFSKAVRMLTKYNAVIRRYKDDLLEFAELRNAIVHNRVDAVQVIAEPHDSIVEQIERIEAEITKPKLVIPQFKKEVHTFDKEDSLSSLLQAVKEKGYSKFPIYDGANFIGLVTENGITKWLAENNETPITEVAIEQIMPYQKDNNHEFIAKHATIYEAIELFKDNMEKGNRVDALLITENGERSEKLIGIITAWDMMGVQ
ncbi:CBS domain-containing protein [Ornithinibacillus sp. FSL M8-0202]|uniref:CBS domain-containing protein n=1 Tax=unclassified Ornithinibacillus TaxID=2620869 RepID=UPI0030CE354C